MNNKSNQLIVSPIKSDSNSSDNNLKIIDFNTKTIVAGMDKLSCEEKSELLMSSKTIISKGIDLKNNKPQKIVGLIIGHVQSGKTSSFTTVASLAQENRYPIIIVITGNSRILSIQSEGRLIKDLQIDSQSIDTRWDIHSNPKVTDGIHQDINHILSEYESNENNTTVLFTVMKNHSHIKNLTHFLKLLNIGKLPVLIIDDEADQASLNNKPNKDFEKASTTYKNISALLDIFERKYYLQYTATPQANLLICIQGLLSPDFCAILKPGSQYIGGKELFVDNSDHVCIIPDDEIPDKDINLTKPPESLKKALALYFTGVAIGRIEKKEDIAKRRSMLIHPSKEKIAHGNYTEMVSSIKSYWLGMLSRTIVLTSFSVF